MEGNVQKPNFEVDVPYNHPVLIAGRKRMKKLTAWLELLALPFFILCTVGAFIGKNSATWVKVLFVCIDVLLLVCVLLNFFKTKANAKGEKFTIKYRFFEHGMQVVQLNQQNNKVKVLENCLYVRNSNKQYVSKIVEENDKLTIKIYTGTYNGVPQHHVQIVPKDVVANLNEFIKFLQDRLLENYQVKQTKKN